MTPAARTSKQILRCVCGRLILPGQRFLTTPRGPLCPTCTKTLDKDQP